MSYATIVNIQDEFRDITFDTSTDITSVRVQEFLDQADAEINLMLGSRYETPITGVESLKIVKRIEIAIVAARVASILDLKGKSQNSIIKQEFNKKDYEKESRELLDRLKDQDFILPDAVLLDTSYGMKSSLVDDGVTPIFKKGVDQW